MQNPVSNPTDTLTPEDLPHMFERFWRKDPARSDSGHAGLGLSLAQALIARLGHDIQVALQESHCFSVSLTL
jgi:two-component system sensor histidine kinase QseC